MIYSDKQIFQMKGNEIDEAIKKLEDLQKECRGSFYPNVLQGEIEKLEKQKRGEFVPFIEYTKSKYRYISNST